MRLRHLLPFPLTESRGLVDVVGSGAYRVVEDELPWGGDGAGGEGGAAVEGFGAGAAAGGFGRLLLMLGDRVGGVVRRGTGGGGCGCGGGAGVLVRGWGVLVWLVVVVVMVGMLILQLVVMVVLLLLLLLLGWTLVHCQGGGQRWVGGGGEGRGGKRESAGEGGHAE